MLRTWAALGSALGVMVAMGSGCSDDCPSCPCGADAGIDYDASKGPDGNVAVDTGAGDASADAGPAVCGNGVVEGDEQCDLGEGNGPESNCLINCATNPIHYITLGGEFLGLYEEQPAVDGKSDATTAYTGQGCWAATPDEDTNLDGQDKFELFLDPSVEEAAFLGPFTVDDIAEVFYATRKPADEPQDFYLMIYTVVDYQDDSASWYGYRLTGEPVYARNIEATAGQWTVWSTAEGPNQLTFFDYDHLHAYGVMVGQPTLPELQASDAFDWSTVRDEADATEIDYGAEKVKYLSIQTASGWSADFAGQIDHVGLLLKDGRGVVFDLEP